MGKIFLHAEPRGACDASLNLLGEFVSFHAELALMGLLLGSSAQHLA